MPADTPLHTVNNPLPVGTVPQHRDEDGPCDIASVSLRDNVLILGQTGSGTTQALMAILFGALQYPDAVRWGIDLQDGPLTALCEQDVPAVDRLATNLDTATRMVEAALAVAAERRHNVGRKPPTAEMPAIVLLVASAPGVETTVKGQAFLHQLATLTRIGPAGGVYVVVETKPMLYPLDGQFGTRILMGPAKLMGYDYSRLLTLDQLDRVTDLAAVPHRTGYALIVTNNSVVPADLYNRTLPTVRQVAEQTVDQHATLDPAAMHEAEKTWQLTLDTSAVVADIIDSGSVGQRLADLVEAYGGDSGARAVARIQELLDDQLAAGVLVLHPADPSRYVHHSKRAPRELGTLALPADVSTMADWLNVMANAWFLAQERAGVSLSDRGRLTTDHLRFDEALNRVIAYDRPPC